MKLLKLLKIYMQINDLGLRELGKEIGVSASTLSRLLNGKEANFKTAMKIIKWLLTA